MDTGSVVSPARKIMAVILGVVVLGALAWGFRAYFTGKTLPLGVYMPGGGGIPARDLQDGELARIYRSYVAAVGEAVDQKSVEPLKVFAVTESRRKQLDEFASRSGEKQELAFSLLAGLVPEEFEVVNELIEGDRGVLFIQDAPKEDAALAAAAQKKPPPGYRNAERKPVAALKYRRVFLVRQDGAWGIEREAIVRYADPRPAFEAIDGKSLGHLGVQYHCNFQKDVSSCASDDKTTNPSPDACYQCFAKLTLNASLCERITAGIAPDKQSDPLFKDNIAAIRADCVADVAALTGDLKLCAGLPDREILGTNFRALCAQRIAGHDFIPRTNIFRADSDRDGLTDLLEAYFNTSIASADTDGDGASDRAEVEAMTNPLGEGKLGDHLK